MGTWTLVTRQASLILILGCGDNLPGRPDAALIDALIDARTDAPIDAPLGLPFVELSPVSGYNQASETLVAAHGNNVVVVTTEQDFPSADSFAYPTNADADPNHPFRKLIYSTSHDRGDTFSTSTVLIDASRTDPLLAVSADGTFWSGGNSPDLSVPRSDLVRSTDGGDTFALFTTVPLSDKGWLTVDEARQAIWMTGFRAYRRFGFDGSTQATVDTATAGVSASYSDNDGLHFIIDDGFEQFTWNGLDSPVSQGMLFDGDTPNVWTDAAVAMGVANGTPWVVRAIHDTTLGSPLVLRLGVPTAGGVDIPITAPGAVAFLPNAALDDQGRLHVVYYETSGPVGRLLYSHSVGSDLSGSYTDPIVVDGDACPGNGWYPYNASIDPPGGRRLREYIGIAIEGSRVFMSWTHAPEAPSRVRVAHVDL